jgi:alpha-glucosidase
MRLLLDWVPNHSSSDHPWFVESRSSIDNAKRDWYVWRDRPADGAPPTNWMAQFKGVPAWTHDEVTDQSYLHVFLSEQPDLNWANPYVEAAMHHTLRYWLDRGVDGFRADVVNLIGKGADVDDLPEHLVTMPLLATDRLFGHELLRRIRSLLDGYEHEPMMVGEVYLLREGESASYLGDLAGGAPELHLSFDFRPLHTTWEADRMQGALSKMETDFAEPRWPTFVLSNHDQPRHRTRYGTEARARAAAVLSLTIRGTPFLYAGEELGLEDAIVPPDRVVDPDGRDGCRAPMPWTADGDDQVGHGWPTRPWLPFPTNATTHAASSQAGDPASMHTLYRELLALRHDHEVLRRGAIEFAPLDRGEDAGGEDAGGEGDGDVIRFERRLDDERVVVLVNVSDAAMPWPTDLADAPVLLSTDRSRRASGGELAPDEAVVLHATRGV